MPKVYTIGHKYEAGEIESGSVLYEGTVIARISWYDGSSERTAVERGAAKVAAALNAADMVEKIETELKSIQV